MKIYSTDQNTGVDKFQTQVYPQLIENKKIQWANSDWVQNANQYKLTKLGYVVDSSIYSLKCVIVADLKNNDGSVKLYLNTRRDVGGRGEEMIKSWEFNHVEDIKKSLKEVMVLLNITTQMFDDIGKIIDPIRLTKIKKQNTNATELKIVPEILSIHKVYFVRFIKKDLETGYVSKPMNYNTYSDNDTKNKKIENYDDLLKVVDFLLNIAKKAGYVDASSSVYIPDGVDRFNFDFVRNRWKDDSKYKTEPSPENEKEADDSFDLSYLDETDLEAKSKSKIVVAQDFEGFADKSVVDYGAGMVGSSSVDASQIKSFFGKTSDALSLVNQYSSGLLSNVSFIFNFSRGGAYGVYVSELDRAIKTEVLKKRLEQQGYKIDVNEQGLLTAYPSKEETDNDKISSDINSLYKDIDSKGSTCFGINMGAIISSSKSDAMAIKSSDPNLWEWIAVLHLGATIVHEAVHSQGNTGEGASESEEQKFLTWALPIINDQYKKSLETQGKGEEFTPLVIGTQKRHAKKSDWYKTAQSLPYMSHSNLVSSFPIGSDLSGRFSTAPETDEGRADWGLIGNMASDLAIEKRLGRENMMPLPEDLKQEHDSIELQLRKYTREDMKIDAGKIIDELLRDGYDENRGYSTIEALLDEKRPKPLMTTLKKEASISKLATLFGWMNNLSISDGSTIPGLGDRVMAWDDRDEDFAEEESWIKKQPRYNPEYDLKGFYYRWIEPRNKPQLFDDMARDYSMVSPAKRFASSDNDIHKVTLILSNIKSRILKNKIKATRLMASEDLLPTILEVIKNDNLLSSSFPIQDDVYSVWVYNRGVAEEDIERAEQYFNGQGDETIGDMVNGLFGTNERKEKVFESLISCFTKIAQDYGLDINIGARNMLMVNSGMIDVNLSNVSNDLFDKLMSLVADEMNVDIEWNKNGPIINYNGFLIRFKNKGE